MSETELKPCPFCGEPVEVDRQRRYVGYNHKVGSAVAIYCSQCLADMTLCREDFPQHDTDELLAMVAEKWNAREPERESDALRRELGEWRQLFMVDGRPETAQECRIRWEREAFFEGVSRVIICGQLRNQLAAAKKKIEELKRDKERIDYLDGRECVTWERRPTHQPDGIELRSALDAAIAQAKGAE